VLVPELFDGHGVAGVVHADDNLVLEIRVLSQHRQHTEEANEEEEDPGRDKGVHKCVMENARSNCGLE